jgi:hypothetical protein
MMTEEKQVSAEVLEMTEAAEGVPGTRADYIRIGDLAEILDRSPQTIKNWYKWLDQQGPEMKNMLPEVYLVGSKGIRHFKKSDIPKFKKFRDGIKYGSMAEFNSTLWGKRSPNKTE